MNGQVMREWSELGDFVVDDPLLVLFNAYWEAIPFALPTLDAPRPWRLVIDTARPALPEHDHPGAEHGLEARSLVVLKRARGGPIAASQR